jgi:bifunctional DNase/RNase
MLRGSWLVTLPFLALAVPWAAELAQPGPPPAPPLVAPDRAQVDVLGIVPSDAGPVVVLRSRDAGQLMPVWIGEAEARAIERALGGAPAPRPLTHDLLASVVAGLGAAVQAVEVSDLVDGTFIGTAVLETERGELRRVDARPSDLLALALRTGAPIYVARAVLEEARIEGLDPRSGLDTWNP